MGDASGESVSSVVRCERSMIWGKVNSESSMPLTGWFRISRMLSTRDKKTRNQVQRSSKTNRQQTMNIWIDHLQILSNFEYIGFVDELNIKGVHYQCIVTASEANYT